MQLTGLAPAKINVTLCVLGRREDGFHEIDTLMVPLDFGDRITVAAAPELTVTRSGPTASGLPEVTQDLVWRAATLLADQAQNRGLVPGAHITVHKEIPTAAGLGGGSADAAVTLRLLNQLWGLGLPEAALMELGARLGSDVPFFFAGGAARAGGRGEIVTALPKLPPFWAVLVMPGVSKEETGAVYRQLHRFAEWPRPNVDAALAAWQAGDWAALTAVAGNTLALPMYAAHPELQDVVHAVERAGAVMALMSGAGPTIFGLVPDHAEAIAVANRLKEQFPGVRVAQAVTG